MKEYIIVTDSTTDLPASYADEYNLKVIPLGYTIDGKNYLNNLDHQELSTRRFYDMLSQGKTVKTSQVNPNDFYTAFKEILDNGYGVLG